MSCSFKRQKKINVMQFLKPILIFCLFKYHNFLIKPLAVRFCRDKKLTGSPCIHLWWLNSESHQCGYFTMHFILLQRRFAFFFSVTQMPHRGLECSGCVAATILERSRDFLVPHTCFLFEITFAWDICNAFALTSWVLRAKTTMWLWGTPWWGTTG